MTSVGFNTGLKALLASQSALDTVGHNIANMGVEGYSQQKVLFNTTSPMQVRGLLVGTGVSAASIQRSFDSVLESRIFARRAVGMGFEARTVSLRQIEDLFAEPNGFSLGKSMNSFFASVADLAGAPEDGVLRTSTAQAATDLTSLFNQLASTVKTFGVDNEAQIKSEVSQVNDLAMQISELNKQISEIEATGISANDLRDQRGVVLNALSDVVGIKAVENGNGTMTVTVGGATLVGSKGAYKMSVKTNTGAAPEVRLQNVTGTIDLEGGRLGAHLDVSNTALPGISNELDKLAKELIFQVNKVHTTAVPGKGPYNLLVAENAIGDVDGDGKFADELLNNGSLPFDIKSGDLYVTMTEAATGEIVKHKLSLNANKSTLGDLTEALNAIPNLNAEISSLGSLRIVSDAGYGYDFSPTLDANPDNHGAFGSGKASLGTLGAEPFTLSSGQTLDLNVDLAGIPTPVSLTFDIADFEDITEATAAEIAAVINADPSAQAAGLEAADVGGHLVLQTAGSGADEAFDVVGGTALGGLGWGSFAGTQITGSDNPVAPVISGSYDGDDNGVFTFVPTGDGVVGTTPGLGVEVYNEKGDLVVTLDVGEGYVPGSDIVVANGISVSFGLGELSATEGDRFDLDVVGDPDQTDVLVALGLGGLFTGSGALDMGVREDIELDPSLLAAGFGQGESDGSALLSVFATKDITHATLGGGSFDEFYSQLVGSVGFEASTAETAMNANNALLNSLQQQREQVSGVNLDEEMTNMLRYEQSYQAAAQYIQAVNSLNEAVLSLI